MSVKNIMFGKADYGYFVDINCNGDHEGVCGSDNPLCSFKNLVCGDKSKRLSREIAFQAARDLNVPIETDWD